LWSAVDKLASWFEIAVKGEEVQEGRNEIGEGIHGIKKKGGMEWIWWRHPCRGSKLEYKEGEEEELQEGIELNWIWWRHPVELAVGVWRKRKKCLLWLLYWRRKRAVERIVECGRKISFMVRNCNIRRRSAGRKEFGEGIRGMKKKCGKEWIWWRHQRRGPKLEYKEGEVQEGRKEGINLVKASVEFKKKCRKEGMNLVKASVEFKKKCRKEGRNLVKASVEWKKCRNEGMNLVKASEWKRSPIIGVQGEETKCR
jgi:hypothetical protein